MNGSRIKREHVPRITEDFLLVNELDFFPYTICGSYRRGKKDCGDIEVVFNMNPSDELALLRARIARVFGYTLQGNPKMQGLWGNVQFDLFIASDLQLGAMLLHATGSGLFNIKMRASAKSLGLLLNQYGLWRGETPVVLGKEEKPIFDYLSMEYVKPENRSC